MDRSEYHALKSYMLECTKGSSHDREHIRRVLNLSLEIASHETGVNTDVLIAACILHDIGRAREKRNAKLDHAEIGSKMAYHWLKQNGWPEVNTVHVRECILTHRWRNGQPPVSVEAKILFDADKLDAAGAMGIARALLMCGEEDRPLYVTTGSGRVSDGQYDEIPSFFQHYRQKLQKLYDRLFTERGKELGLERQKAAEDFYQSMLIEARAVQDDGKLSALLQEA